MANLIRNEYGLLTLRCWIEFRQPAGPDSPTEGKEPPTRVVMSQLFDGSQPLSEAAETQPELLGLSFGSNEGRPTGSAQLANTVIGAQVQQAARLAEQPILWFHIPQDSYELALLPWEAMVYEMASLSLLRIANFLEDPYQPSLSPTIAICASQPIADGPFPLADYVTAMLRSLDLAASIAGVRPQVHVFADAQWLPSVRQAVNDTLAGKLRSPRLDVAAIPDAPPGASDGDEYRSAAGGVRSPWLRWILDHFAGQAVDAAHFISPGYFHDNKGAIALAERPDHNSKGGDFSGASELASFYDRLGCSVMGFSSPDMPQWEWGQRMLAFELSWLRPGPVLVYEREQSGYASLARIYSLLFGAGREPLIHWPMGKAPAHLCCHPHLLERRSATDDSIASFAETANLDAELVLNLQTLRLARAQLAPTRPLTQPEQWERSGTASALDFLSNLVDEP